MAGKRTREHRQQGEGGGGGGGGGGALDETKTQDKVREGVPVEESSFWK